MRDTVLVQSAFQTVVLVVCAIGVAGAVAALLLNRRTWQEYGRNQLVRDSEGERAAAGTARAVAAGERDDEIRQMLEARNARRRRTISGCCSRNRRRRSHNQEFADTIVSAPRRLLHRAS